MGCQCVCIIRVMCSLLKISRNAKFDLKIETTFFVMLAAHTKHMLSSPYKHVVIEFNNIIAATTKCVNVYARTKNIVWLKQIDNSKWKKNITFPLAWYIPHTLASTWFLCHHHVRYIFLFSKIYVWILNCKENIHLFETRCSWDNLDLLNLVY